MGHSRPQSRPAPVAINGRILTRETVWGRDRIVRESRMRLALEAISQLDTLFEEPLEAARAAVRIAKEALR